MAWMGHPMDGPMPGMASQEEIDRLGTLPPEQADELFLWLMIPHHEAAIPMARAIEERSEVAEVDLFAEKVAATQRMEVENMQNMLEGMEAPPGKGRALHGRHGHGRGTPPRRVTPTRTP
jgi:uncharacterized protein (DUF305 family)